MKKLLVAPSILSADFAEMGEAVRMLEREGADWVHVDVMDGVFVPNISFGQKMVKDISQITSLPLDVHLMITEPLRYIEQFAQNGADIITFHIEATDKILETIAKIKDNGKKVGLSIKPATPVDELKPYINDIDLILIMSVEPGFGGQKFMEIALNKIEQTKNLIGNRNIIIEVDGGITEQNVSLVKKHGADVVVAGSTVFKAQNKAEIITILQNAQ